MSRRDEVLVSTDWVAAHADDPAHVLVEVDEDTAAYEGGHIRNAIAWHWRDDLHAAPRRDFLDQEALVGAPARAPASGPDTTVVLYGGNNNWFATYAYWLLRYLGFDRVKLMDGGPQEVGARGPRAGRPTSPPRAAADPGPLAPGAARATAPSATTCSTTSAARAGRWWTSAARPSSPARSLAPPHLPQEQAQVPGHIPGAANVPWASAAQEDGSFKSDDELRAIYGSKAPDARHGRDLVLPHRRALQPHLVRAPRAARLRAGAQLRRLVDGVRLAGGRPRRAVAVAVGRRGERVRPDPAPAREVGRRPARGRGLGLRAQARRLPGDRASRRRRARVWSRAGKPLDRYFPELTFPPGPLRRWTGRS